jgi:bisphosphoglycerate-independent phosphoglycerate mutase (AlkP superfamily)
MFRKLKYKRIIKTLTKMINDTGWEMVIIADHGDSMELGSKELIDCQKAHKRYSKINNSLTDYRAMYREYLERDFSTKKIEE